ncbi:MAG: acyl carrier protein [Acidimicrobiales bacterium]
MADTVTSEQVLADIERLLIEVIGDDLLLDGPLTMETSFDEDLQLESIEFVALSEKLLETYGEQVDFVGWLAEMELDDIIALTVGQLVEFVTAQANIARTGSADA